jgi:hypothetical protein
MGYTVLIAALLVLAWLHAGERKLRKNAEHEVKCDAAKIEGLNHEITLYYQGDYRHNMPVLLRLEREVNALIKFIETGEVTEDLKARFPDYAASLISSYKDEIASLKAKVEELLVYGERVRNHALERTAQLIESWEEKEGPLTEEEILARVHAQR